MSKPVMSKPVIENQTSTPPELARRWRCSPEKVHVFIRNGQLAAFNIGTGKTKPRYRISQQAIDDFELARSAVAPPKPTRRKKRRDPDVIEFF